MVPMTDKKNSIWYVICNG